MIRLVDARVESQDAFRGVGIRSGGHIRETNADRKAPPTLTGVVTAVDLAIFVTDENGVGVFWMKQDRPYRQTVILHRYLFPVITTVLAAVRTGLGARIDDLRIDRM